MRNLRAVAPDANEFPEFDDDLREAFQRETELFIASQIREDRSVTNLLDADYTFVNERLARHYGLPRVYGSHFRRVTIERPERYGLLGHGSVLTVTSYATRTSPVVRGKWLLENILGAPPPAPPANVPALKENGEGGRVMSVRERMEEHRKNPVCASCHTQMDPLGFALENFDAIGKWRDRGEDGLPIDASGALPNGTKFDGPVALRHLLLSRRDAFAMSVAEKMLTYALGRGLSPTDRPALRRIMRDAAATDYRWSSVLLGIVKSTPFQMRTIYAMIITGKALPRRTVLRGLGAAVALPLLDSMVPAYAAVRTSAAAPRRRLGIVYVPHGAVMNGGRRRAREPDSSSPRR